MRRSLPIILGGLALSAAACNSASPTPTATVPRVLGQQTGTPTVIGQPAPAGTGDLGAVSCADADHCWAVGVAGPNTTAAITPPGTTTSSTTAGTTVPPTAPATTTTPPSTTTSTIAGSTATTAPGSTATEPTTPTPSPVTVITATVDGGLTWTPQHLTLVTSPELSGISCPAITMCMAVGSTGAVPGTGIVLTTRDGGATWNQAALPDGAFVVTSVQCATVSACTAIVNDGTNITSAQTTNFGRSWQQEGTLPAGLQNARDISCSAGGTCLVAGYSPTTTGHGQGAIAISTDGGQTWAAAGVPPGVGVLQSATCLSATTCLAGGSTSTTVSDVVPAKGLLLDSVDGGHTWFSAPHQAPIDDVFAIACQLAKVCTMVGTQWVGAPAIGTGAAAQSGDGGVRFTRVTTAYVPLTLTAVSCPTDQGCIAVGGDILARLTLPAPKAVAGGTGKTREGPLR